ncbi:unnamed protein product, partial [Prorocentrum cordatum]
ALEGLGILAAALVRGRRVLLGVLAMEAQALSSVRARRALCQGRVGPGPAAGRARGHLAE